MKHRGKADLMQTIQGVPTAMCPIVLPTTMIKKRQSKDLVHNINVRARVMLCLST